MTTLHTRCSAQTKDQFHALAASHGVSASMLLRQMILTVLAQNGGTVSACRDRRPAADVAGVEASYDLD
ncbi:MAG: hypothetical protein ABI132_07170 [Rhodanobacteraceae bacterium]